MRLFKGKIANGGDGGGGGNKDILHARQKRHTAGNNRLPNLEKRDYFMAPKYVSEEPQIFLPALEALGKVLQGLEQKFDAYNVAEVPLHACRFVAGLTNLSLRVSQAGFLLESDCFALVHGKKQILKWEARPLCPGPRKH